jgi:hypothetical protein
MSHTRRLTRLALEPAALRNDLDQCDRFRYSDAYNEFTCGSWKGAALCNNSGDIHDTRITDYEGPCRITDHGARMPYVMEVVRENFRTEHLRFVRLGRITPGSVMVPHRDYLELEEDLTRIHLPLHTSPDCYSSENDSVYQMKLGDVWFIDATQAHSAVSFFTEDRTHLILDFGTATVEEALRFEPDPSAGIPADALVPRSPLTAEQRDALLGLSAVITPYNYRDVLALVIKQYFVSEISVEEIFELSCKIAAEAGQADALSKLTWLHTHALVARLD